jgi:hypothetical protein
MQVAESEAVQSGAPRAIAGVDAGKVPDTLTHVRPVEAAAIRDDCLTPDVP